MDVDRSIRRLLTRLLRDETGQDLIEYALLAAFIGFCGVLAWQNVGVSVSAKYLGWDSGVQGISACTPDPIDFGGGGCP
jgi:Flp pilus assembly pilin Flp